VGPTAPISSTTHSYSVALIGNPNSGKTTLFNSLTGSNYKVANYPGVTVEKRQGTVDLEHGATMRLIDLPGTYALSGSTLDETIVTSFLRGELDSADKPDLIVAVVDATNLERNLFVVSELIDIGLPMVVALNMMDLAEEREMKIYVDLFSRVIDLPVVPIIARSKQGLSELKGAITKQLTAPSLSKRAFAWIPNDNPRAKELRETAEPRHIRELDQQTITTIATLRYAWIRSLVNRFVVHQQHDQNKISAIDSLVTSKVWGLPILLALFGLVFQAIFLWAQIPMEYIGGAFDGLSSWVRQLLPAGILTDLLADGVIAGVGNVLVFIPQIAVLFIFIGILEDSGYLSRAAFLLDNFMRHVGLQGRAFIPLLSSFACAVPGILATRTIPSRTDRLITIMIAPLMGCSARLPVYTVLIAAAVPPLTIGGILSLQGLVLLALYALGVLGACLVSFVLQHWLRRKESCFFVMEMPPLRLPVAKVVLRGAYDSVVSFVRNATTIILACSIIIWFLASYPKPSAEQIDSPVKASYAGQLGTLIEPVIKPLGFNWEIGFSIIASFPAREVFVTGLSTVLSVQNDDDNNSNLIKQLELKRNAGTFSTATALSLLVFYVFACQCMSTLAVCKRETGSWLWTIGLFTYTTLLAYLASLITYQICSRI
jgi:ferrous iron transport protein B